HDLWTGTLAQVRLDPIKYAAIGDSVAIDYVRILEPSGPAPEVGFWEFNREGDAEGWRYTRGVEDAEVINGELRGTISDCDPQLKSLTHLGLNGDEKALVEIGYTINSTYDLAQFYWGEGDLVPGSGGRGIEFNVISDGQFHVAAFDFSTHPNWGGTINQFRLDPLKTPAMGDTVAIDHIRVRDTSSFSDPLELQWEFETAGDAEGWSTAGFGTTSVMGGQYRAELVGPEGVYISPNEVRWNPQKYTELLLGIRAYSSGDLYRLGRLQWSAGEEDPVLSSRGMDFQTLADGELHEMVLYLGGQPTWEEGYLSNLAIMPLRDGVTGESIHLDYVRLMEPETVWDFETEGVLEGWSASDDLTNVSVSGGMLQANVIGTHPTLVQDFVEPVNSEIYNKLEITYQAISSSISGAIGWAREGEELGSLGQIQDFEVLGDGQLHTILVSMAKNVAWYGSIESLSVELPSTAQVGDTLEVESIRLLSGDGDVWVEDPDPEATKDTSFTARNKLAFSVGNEIWYFVEDLFILDPVANTWTQKAREWPTELLGGTATADAVYVLGTYGRLWKYDRATQIWSRAVDAPEGTDPVGMTSAQDRVFTFGMQIMEYNPAFDTWVQLLTLPESFAQNNLAAIGEIIYLTSATHIYKYSPEWNELSVEHVMNPERPERVVTACLGKLYFTGGPKPTEKMEMYDPSTGVFSQKADLVRPRTQHAAAGLNDVIYVFNGYNTVRRWVPDQWVPPIPGDIIPGHWVTVYYDHTVVGRYHPEAPKYATVR
ncbi:MAG: hypothetical protein JW937_10285, partial [Candidatus Omnitrophica bacterium]|nr:hypothetical protein [Candidatus Omnitrophota bacterium]